MLSKSRAVLAAFALYATRVSGAEGWSVLKSGMNQSDTVAALGDPLLKNVGRGFELWLYDGGAEVLCFMGVVVAWTAPIGVASPDGRQVDLRPFFKRVGPAVPTRPAGSAAETDLNLPAVREMRLPKI
jgi:hypothetical protein